MLFFQAYFVVWPLCLAFIAFFICVALMTLFQRIPRFERELSTRMVLWVSLTLWFIFMSVVMTLIDSPLGKSKTALR